jgi:excisionase family DNA binding protein
MPTPVPWKPGDGVGVLTLDEAAQRLGVSRTELDRMIDARKLKALPTGFTRMIPSSEVERLSGLGPLGTAR